MESPFKDPRIRTALTFAAFLIGTAYLAIVHHLLPSRRRIAEVPTMVGIVIGCICAALAVVVLGYAWKVYRRIVARNEKSGNRIS